MLVQGVADIVQSLSSEIRRYKPLWRLVSDLAVYIVYCCLTDLKCGTCFGSITPKLSVDYFFTDRALCIKFCEDVIMGGHAGKHYEVVALTFAYCY